MIFPRIAILIAGIAISLCAHAQPPSSQQEDVNGISKLLPRKYLDNVSSTASSIDKKLDKKSIKALQRLKRQEARIKKRLGKTDSLKAVTMFANADQQYKQLEQRLQNAGSSVPYISSLDSFGTSLKFLQQNPKWLPVKDPQEKVKATLGKVESLKNQFQKADEIKKFLQQRKQYLKDQLNQLGFAKELKRVNKQVYYYSEQVKAYKELLKDHTKAQKKAIELLSKTKLFKDFFRKNSQLASLFRLPGDPNDPSSQASLAGLQTRVQVNNLIQQRLAAGGAGAQQQFLQNIQNAQTQLKQLKDKILKGGRSSSDEEMPEGFKPNSQNVKTFLQRIELGVNIQSQRANGFFPTTSDIGLSVGYKLNDKSILGIGASYKMGWGKDIRHVNITHQGVGLRSFVDWKVKGSLWLSGGFETNYRSEFKSIEELKNLNAWQQSGLIGISKVVSIKAKFFKKTKLQLLWDFLSYQQAPRTQAIVFRIGYNF